MRGKCVLVFIYYKVTISFCSSYILPSLYNKDVLVICHNYNRQMCSVIKKIFCMTSMIGNLSYRIITNLSACLIRLTFKVPAEVKNEKKMLLKLYGLWKEADSRDGEDTENLRHNDNFLCHLCYNVKILHMIPQFHQQLSATLSIK